MPRKTYHEIDPEEAIQALSFLKDEPNFKKYIEMRETMREEVIRQLQIKEVVDSTNRHYMLCGKLEAIDEELDTFYKLWIHSIHGVCSPLVSCATPTCGRVFYRQFNY